MNAHRRPWWRHAINWTQLVAGIAMIPTAVLTILYPEALYDDLLNGIVAIALVAVVTDNLVLPEVSDG